MCKFIGKSNERILCKLRKSEILRLYSIVHVAMETTKTSNFTCQSKSFISIFFTCQVSACELQPFSCHDLANDIYSQTAKTVFNHLKWLLSGRSRPSDDGGFGHPDPEIMGRGQSQKIFFQAFGPQFGLKNKGTCPSPPGSSPRSATAVYERSH